jgi:hypothetical protein
MNDREAAMQRALIGRQKIASASLITNTGYVAVCFSPRASADKQATQKLAVALTFEEWRAIGELLEEEASIPWSIFSRTDLLDFLRDAIRSIPSPAVAAQIKLEDVNPLFASD